MTSDDLKKALDALHDELDAGKIDLREYNARRKQLRDQAKMQEAKEAEEKPAEGAASATTEAEDPKAAAEAAAEAALEAALDQVSADLREGKIDMREYNARRKALKDEHARRQEEAEAAAKPEAKPEEKPAEAKPEEKPAEAKPEAAADAPKPEPAKPSAWGGAKEGPKVWSGDTRTDDPSVRKIFPPLAKGIGDGRAVHFLFGFRLGSKNDQDMMAREIEHIQDDIEVLRNAGYTVVLDPQGTKREFLDAVAGKGEGAEGLVPAALYWSGHGHEDGALDCCDGALVRPSDLDPATVSPGLRIAILAACYVGAHSRTWKKALGDRPLVVGWGRPVTIDRAVDFLDANPETETDLDDLIRRYLLADNPLPGEKDNAYNPLEPKAGRVAELPKRMQSVAAMLGARWREHPKTIEIDVPLPERRSHYVHLSVVDSAQPYSEGEPLLAVEGDVGEITTVVDIPMLLAGISDPGYARVVLVKGDKEMPRICAQGFLPLARVRDADLAALVYQVAATADEIERRIFGGDLR